MPWRSSLYPDDWTPAWRDAEGRFLHDFSYAGYRHGEAPLPERTDNIIDATQPPYEADASGVNDATAAIQAALDAAGRNGGGGVVFLPAGTYRVAPPEGATAALRIRDSHVMLRGAGAGRTFVFNDTTAMRGKRVIEVAPRTAASWAAEGKVVAGAPLTADLPEPSLRVPVADVSGFAVGEPVVVRNDLTEHFIGLVEMDGRHGGKWTPAQSPNRTLAYYRRILEINTEAGALVLDVPVRGWLFTADNARVVRVSDAMLTEVGVEDLSIGMRQHPGEGLAENDWQREGTVGYDAHGSVALQVSFVGNGWIRRVNSWSPPGNDPSVHVLSNGIRLWRSRLVTVAECDWRFPQYRGGGGNGYLYTHNGQDNLIRDCRAEGARHNYDFGTMIASGNVILDCVAKDGELASDFHMFLSLANLLDNVTCDGDSLEARAFRPWGGNPVHGVTTTQSVFWRSNGLRYPPKRPMLVQSHQVGEGYVIGTRGPAARVDSSDFVEGEGKGDGLTPRSLYLDQLGRRLKDRAGR